MPVAENIHWDAFIIVFIWDFESIFQPVMNSTSKKAAEKRCKYNYVYHKCMYLECRYQFGPWNSATNGLHMVPKDATKFDKIKNHLSKMCTSIKAVGLLQAAIAQSE